MNALLLSGTKSARQVFREEGILFYPSVFEGEELVRLREACEYVLDQFVEEMDRTGTELTGLSCMRHLNDLRWHTETKKNLLPILEAVADPRCLGPVEQIFRGTSLFRSTSLFFNPRSTSYEGGWHRDPQFSLGGNEDAVREHISKGVVDGLQFQIALVDNDDVEYVPFSASRYDSPEELHIRCGDGGANKTSSGMPNAMRVHQRAGDAIVFNPQGLHRGRYLKDNPRRTLMITYTPRDEPYYDYFSTQPWMLEPEALAGLSSRARAYFADFIDVYAEYWASGAEDTSAA